MRFIYAIFCSALAITGCGNNTSSPATTPRAVAVENLQGWPDKNGVAIAKKIVLMSAAHYIEQGDISGFGIDWGQTLGICANLHADKILHDYLANEVAADDMYKGKRVIITGSVTQIGKDITGDAFLSLRAGGNPFNSVQAYLHPKEVSAAAKVSKGQRAVVACQVSGLFVGSVVLKDCMRLQSYESDVFPELEKHIDNIFAKNDPSINQLPQIKAVAFAGYVAALRGKSEQCLHPTPITVRECGDTVGAIIDAMKNKTLSESEITAAKHMGIDFSTYTFK